MAKTNIFILAFLALCWMRLMSGCSNLMDRRSFSGQMKGGRKAYFTPGRNFRLVAGDSGKIGRTPGEIAARTPASIRTVEQMRHEKSLKEELSRKERRLSLIELERYSRIRGQLKSDSERIYYLDLHPRERRQYLLAKSIIRPKMRQNGRKGPYPGHGSTFLPPFGGNFDPGTLPNMGPSTTVRKASRAKAGPAAMPAERGLASLSPYHHRKGELFLGMSKAQVLRAWGRPGRVDIAGNPKYQNERWAFFAKSNVYYVFFEAGSVQGWQLD